VVGDGADIVRDGDFDNHGGDCEDQKMVPEMLSELLSARKVYRDAYNNSRHAAECLAGVFLLLEGKPEEERREILVEAESLAHRIVETFDGKKPATAALGLMFAIRVLEKMVEDQMRGTR